MFCSNCSTDNKPGRAFCVECGTRLAAACPNCGSPSEPAEKFCGTCGTPLGGDVPGSSAQAGASTGDGGRRPEALAGYREAFRREREAATDFEYALMVIDALIALGPDEPEIARAADEAREILERVGARPHLEKLEAVLTGEPRRPAGTRSTSALSRSRAH